MEAVERWQAWGAKVFPTVIHTRRGGVEKDWHLKTWPLETWSAAKPGQVPGLIVEGPFVAIDCDSTFAEDYWEDVRLEHMAECHWIEKTLRGHKYIFRLPPEVKLKSGWYGRGIRRFEILTRFTVAPCYRDGTDSKGVACRYQVLSPEGSEPGPLPPKLLEELVRWSAERRPSKESTEDIREDAPVRDPVRYVDALVVRIQSLPSGQGERQSESNKLVFQVGRVFHAFTPTQQAIIEEACFQAVLTNGLEKDRAVELVPRALKDGMAKPKPVQVAGVVATPTPATGTPTIDPGDSWETLNTNADAEEAEPWLVPGVLPSRGIVLAIGEQKSGKTWWASILAGLVLSKGHGVSYAMQESAQSILRARLKLTLRGADVARFRSLYRRGHHLRDDVGLANLVTAVRANDSRFLVVDSLTRFCRGLDLNKSEVMSEVGNRLERLSAEAGCCVLVLHHVRKSGQGENARKELSPEDSRHSGDLLAVASIIALVERATHQDKGFFRFTVRCGDSWYTPFETECITLDFGAETIAVEARNEQGRDDTQLREAICKVIERSPLRRLSQRAIREASDVREVTRNGRWVAATLDSMEGDGVLRVEDGPRRAKLYSLDGVVQ